MQRVVAHLLEKIDYLENERLCIAPFNPHEEQIHEAGVQKDSLKTSIENDQPTTVSRKRDVKQTRKP